MKSITEQTGRPTHASAESKPTTRPRVGARRAHVMTSKPKPGKKATLAKKAPTGRTKTKVAKAGARSGTKTAKILDLLKTAWRSLRQGAAEGDRLAGPFPARFP